VTPPRSLHTSAVYLRLCGSALQTSHQKEAGGGLTTPELLVTHLLVTPLVSRQLMNYWKDFFLAVVKNVLLKMRHVIAREA
jgi:hypothetical protein